MFVSVRGYGTCVVCGVMSFTRHFERERKFRAVMTGANFTTQQKGAKQSLTLWIEASLAGI